MADYFTTSKPSKFIYIFESNLVLAGCRNDKVYSVHYVSEI